MELVINQHYQFYVPSLPGDISRKTWHGIYIGTYKHISTIRLLFLVDESKSEFGINCYDLEAQEGNADLVKQIKEYFYKANQRVNLNQKFYSRDKEDIVGIYTLKERTFLNLSERYQ